VVPSEREARPAEDRKQGSHSAVVAKVPDDVATGADLQEVTPASRFSRPALVASCATTAAAFLVLWGWVAAHGTQAPELDTSIHAWVVAHRSAGSLTFARAVTWGGVTYVVLPALVAVGALAVKAGADPLRRIRSGVVLGGVAAVGVYLGLRVNALSGRDRPPVADWAGAAGGPSFPSGHTTAATIFAAFAAWAVVARLGPGRARRSLCVGACVYAAAVGWSRVWLGVHWPTDVLGGWLFGATWWAGSAAVILVFRRRAEGLRQAARRP